MLILSENLGFIIGMALICILVGLGVISYVIVCIIRVTEDDTYDRKKRKRYYELNKKHRHKK